MNQSDKINISKLKSEFFINFKMNKFEEIIDQLNLDKNIELFAI